MRDCGTVNGCSCLAFPGSIIRSSLSLSAVGNVCMSGIAEFAGLEFTGLENDGLDVSKQQARLTEVNDGDE